MGSRRKPSLKRLRGLLAQVEIHVNKVIQNPGHSSRAKYRHEAVSWIEQMKEALRHVGKKTAAQWEKELSVLEASLAQAGGPTQE